MILRVRNINDPSDIIMTSEGKVINFQKKQGGVIAEIELNKEYIIETTKSHMRIIHKMILWLIFSLMEFLGNKSEAYLTDALSLNMRLSNAYISSLTVAKCDGVVESLIQDYRTTRCLEVLRFDSKNNSTAIIQYKRRHDKNFIKNEFKRCICEITFFVFFFEVVFLCLANLSFCINVELTLILTVVSILCAIGMLVRYIAFILRNYEMLQSLLRLEELETEKSWYESDKSKPIFLKNKTHNDMHVMIKENNVIKEELLLFAESTKRLFCPQKTDQITIESIEIGRMLSNNNRFYTGVYFLFNYIMCNPYLITILDFGNFVYKNNSVVQNIYGLESKEVNLNYSKWDESFIRTWSMSETTTNNDKCIKCNIEDLYYAWKKNIFIAMLIYCFIMIIAMAIGIIIIGGWIMFIVGICTLIKIIQMTIVLIKGRSYLIH